MIRVNPKSQSMSVASTPELDREIAAFEGMASQLKASHGSGWVLMTRQTFIRMFEDFSEAARYADEHYRGQQVLIRHTERVQDSAPFLAVCR